MHLPLRKQPESVCLLRLSALGDVTHVLPIVHTMRRYWPDTRITWIIGKTEARMLQGIEGVELIMFDKYRGWRGYAALKKKLEHRSFDVLMAMQLSLRANAIAPLVKAPIKLGYNWRRSKDFHQLVINRHIPAHSGQHVLDLFFSFLETLGLNQRELVWNIAIPEDAKQFARSHLPGTQKTLVISPCSSHPLRNWRTEYYAQVADYAISRHGMRVALVGGPNKLERQTGDEIKAQMHGDAIDLIAKDTLKQLLAVLQRASVVLSPDSGPAHMANAVGSAVIALHATSNSRRSGPYSNLDNCVDRYGEAAIRYLKTPASTLRWGTKIERPNVMDLIKPEDVYAKLDALMNQQRQTHDHQALDDR